MYKPYMALGLVCDGSAFGCRPTSHIQGLSYFLTTPVEGAKALHLYDVNLQLKGVSKQVPSIWTDSLDSVAFSHIAAQNNLTFATIGNKIIVFHHLVPSTVWLGHDARITTLSIIGKHLITVDADQYLIVWELPECPKDAPSKIPAILSKAALPPDFFVTCVAHPQTYINKILLGARDGRTLLFNLRTSRIVHTFKPFPSCITVLEPSPIIDVVAVGTEDGSIHLHNFRTDKTVSVFQLFHDLTSTHSVSSSFTIRALSFRTDGIETLAAADSAGNLFVWDLNEKRLSSEARQVHKNGVSYMCFLPGEPILVTAGSVDNSVKIHVFDESTEKFRLLRSREGHYLPPTKVRFCGLGGLTMVSAGLDRELRQVCAVREVRNRPFSQKFHGNQGGKKKKNQRKSQKVEVGDRNVWLSSSLKPVTDISAGNAREKDSEFANIVTLHEGTREAYTWRMIKGASYKHILKPPDRPGNLQLVLERGRHERGKKRRKIERYHSAQEIHHTSCVAITPCGNYAFVGFTDGKLHSFNLQSGIHQGIFRADELEVNEDIVDSEWAYAHVGEVKSVAIDGCGDILASTGSSEGKVKFWGTHQRKRSGEDIDIVGDIIKIVWCETSDLIAFAMQDFSLLIFDASTRKLARSFKAHDGYIVDICFDSQGRRLISASLDGSIKIWDLPSGCLSHILKCDDAPTSISLCPNDEFLASTHANRLSIQLWVNCKRFVGDKIGGATDDGKPSNCIIVTDKMPLSSDVQTLSSRPSNAWTVLSRLREVQERNQPVEIVMKGKNAPFFIPTVKGLSFQFETNVIGNEIETTGNWAGERPDSWEVGDDGMNEVSRFGRLLLNGRVDEADALLKNGDPVTIDSELRSLSKMASIRLCADYLCRALSESSCIELTQAHLHTFLSCHGGALSGEEDGEMLMSSLLQKQRLSWQRLRGSLSSVACLSSHFSGQV